MSAVSKHVNRNNGKKGKKSDQKSALSSQVKCLNEKRRRECENTYIGHIAYILPRSSNNSMIQTSSVKPDKCAILQDAVEEIRKIIQKDGVNFLDQAQKILFPLTFDAFIFIVNSEGRVEFVSENITSFINFNPEDVQGKSIYNIIHHGDHHRFSSCVLPTLGSSSNFNRKLRIRLLVKPLDDLPQDPSKYMEMQIASLPVPFEQPGFLSSMDKSSSPGPPMSPSCLGNGSLPEGVQGNSQEQSVFCIASRVFGDNTSVVSSFTTKLDRNGNVLYLDTTQVSPNVESMLPKSEIEGRSLYDLCVRQNDVDTISNHLQQTVRHGKNETEAVYKILAPGQPASSALLICTKTRLFNDFIMATHKILDDSSQPRSTEDLSAYRVTPTLRSPPRALGNGSNAADTSTYNGDFSFEMPNYDQQSASNWEAPMSDLAPQPVHLQGSPQTPPSVQQSQPQAFAPFSPAGDTPDAPPCDPIKSEPMTGPPSDSARLRDLLTKERSDEANQTDISAADSKDRILKTLLNQEDDRTATSASGSGGGSKPGSDMLLKLLNDGDSDGETRPALKKSEFWKHLLKDSPPSVPVSTSTTNSESLMDSLRFSISPSSPSVTGVEQFTCSSLISGSTRKRLSEDGSDDATTPKRHLPNDWKNNKELIKSNQMLVKLLQKNTPPSTIPAISPSVMMETPQEKLDRQKREHMQAVSLRQASGQFPRPPAGHNMQQIGPPTTANQLSRTQHQPPSSLEMLPHVAAAAPSTITSNNSQTVSHSNKSSLSGILGMNSASEGSYWVASSNQTSSDPLLSSILDDVIDIVPETDPHPADLDHESSATGYQQGLNERQAINEIQKTLMLCESAVETGSMSCSDSNANSIVKDNSKTLPPAYAASPMQSSAQAQFGPPPQYPRSRFTNRTAPYSTIPQQINSQALRTRMAQQQQQQKQRLLLQQERQQLVVGANARAPADENSHQLSMDSLLHNTVAPNVALQRSSSAPDGGQPSPTAPSYSPSFSPVSMGSAQTAQQATAAQTRLSPNYSQQQSQTVYGGGNTSGPGAVPATSPSSGSWKPQQPQPRLSLQQQQNPMLNAQLTAGGYGRSFQQRQQAAYDQPSGYAQPPPPQMRGLQRTVSAPGPGGRHYGYPGGPQPAPPPPPLQQQSQQQAQMYPHNPLPPDSLQQQYGYEAARTGGPNGVTSEYVRQRLGECVGARAQHLHTTSAKAAGTPVVGASVGMSAAAPAPAAWRTTGPGSPFTCDVAVQGARSQQLQQAVAPNDYEHLGLNFDHLAATAGERVQPALDHLNYFGSSSYLMKQRWSQTNTYMADGQRSKFAKDNCYSGSYCGGGPTGGILNSNPAWREGVTSPETTQRVTPATSPMYYGRVPCATVPPPQPYFYGPSP